MEVHKKYNMSRKKSGTAKKIPVDTPAKKNLEILARKNTEVPTQKRHDTAFKPIKLMIPPLASKEIFPKSTWLKNRRLSI